MKKWNVCFGVNVPCYGMLVVEAETAEEAEKIALANHETGKPDDDVWESAIWHNTNLEPLWSEAEEFRLLETMEIKE